MQIKRNILLNPGPATTTDSVKLAQIVPDICPREKEFANLLSEISDELTLLVANTEDFSTILFSGSGTAGVEAVLSSVIPPNKTILIINNGSYGERMCKIADTYNLNYLEFTSSPTEPLDLAELEKIIQNNLHISHLAVVHNETTYGLLNNLNDIGNLAQKYKLELIADCMSSFGAIPINMSKQNINYLIASSNKNLQGIPGIVFVVASNKALQKLKNIKPRSFYLNLYDQYIFFEQNKQMRFTAPVQAFYALKQALSELKEEGLENRYKRYTKSWKTLLNGLEKLKLNYLIDKKYHSKIITSVYMPQGIDFEDLHDYFYSHGFTIYPSKSQEFNSFRVANIGAIDHKDIKQFLELLEKFLTHTNLQS